MGSVEDVNRERSRLVRRAGRVRDARTLARPCYLCDAPVGARCIDISRGYERPPHKMRLRAARAALVALVLLLAAGCFGTDTATCYLEGFEKHDCPTQLLTEDGSVQSGAVSGQMLADWYGDLPPGSYVFVVEKDGGQASWPFELIEQLPEGTT